MPGEPPPAAALRRDQAHVSSTPARAAGARRRAAAGTGAACAADGLRWRCWKPAPTSRGRALYERCGYAPRGPFGGYPDNGLSVFYGKALA
jgi:hypothetical protein